ncbi:NUDIX hydrolase [Parasporobacterium paucivorans]|uniref:NUDIX domain-containing protein n=1 Tax=Parasporobacterium paucivorans DSM 15970 TaxID=1122934 RepID=A0A1M6DLA6_9FIRM|nr:CoA pyrophosphatase [Parasporobacterium paucivorans]SHI73921.1 NUDIX domain-containing protein [Parasporobacterium paucivorans DSM 15970]
MPQIEEFQRRIPGIIGSERNKEYAVLIPILETDSGPALLFEKRANNLNHQPDEICFPGGKLEPDESLLECAVREAAEELLISEDQIEILGPGDLYISPFNLVIHPYIGYVKDYKKTFSRDEVAEILLVPLQYFMTTVPEIYHNCLMNVPTEDFPYERIPGGEKYPWAKGIYDIMFYMYEDQIIWGMTAHIARSAVELIAQYDLIRN